MVRYSTHTHTHTPIVIQEQHHITSASVTGEQLREFMHCLSSACNLLLYSTNETTATLAPVRECTSRKERDGCWVRSTTQYPHVETLASRSKSTS